MLSTLEVMAFEREWLNRPQHDGAKMAAVHERFGVGLVRYYQALVAALDEPAAWLADPVTCRLSRDRMLSYRRVRSA